jgi:hypothetical protein
MHDGGNDDVQRCPALERDPPVTCFLFGSEEEGIDAFQGEILRYERL